MTQPKLDRRHFLRLGAAATAGLTTAVAFTPENARASSKADKKIITRKLGNTGIELPIVSMGVMRADNPNILKAAYQIGIKHFDTAHGYQGGRNEEMVGEFFKDKPRDSFIVSTKIHPDREGISTEKFMEMLDISLKRLKMDHVDILYLHAARDKDYTLDPRYLAALKQAKAEGKAKHLGVTTHTNMAEVINAAVDSKIYEVVLTSYNFRLAKDEELHKALKRANEAGLGIIGMKNMAGGFLDKEKQKPVNCKAALKWALTNPDVHTCIPGFTTYEMLMENWSVASDINLDSKEMSDLQLASNEVGLYCHGCQSCNGQCPENLPIPDLMRSYMYNYGYSYPAKAYETVAALSLPENPCVNCDECTVSCPNGLNVGERVADIARIRNIPGEFLV